jgi:hypothetical protein
MATSLNPVTVAPREWIGGWDSRQQPPGHAGLLVSSGGWVSRLDCRSARAGKEAGSFGRRLSKGQGPENLAFKRGKWARKGPGIL